MTTNEGDEFEGLTIVHPQQIEGRQAAILEAEAALKRAPQFKLDAELDLRLKRHLRKCKGHEGGDPGV